jgi:exosortase
VKVYVYAAVLALGLFAAYWRSMHWVTNLALLQVDTGGGLFAPIVSAYLVWQKRDELRRAQTTGTLWGALALGVGVVVFVAGLYGMFSTLLTLSLVMVVWGLVVWLGGIERGQALLFPIGYLAFLVPAPTALDTISLPLRLFGTRASAILPRMLGMPVRVEGTEVLIGDFRSIIDAPCSGLSYLLALLACATLVAYLSECSFTRKVLLSLSAIPIAVLANVVRIDMAYLLHEAIGGTFSVGVGHILVGLAVLAFATVSLLGVWSVTCRGSTGDS